MIRRRKIEVFSLSFLDCICCGFGAMILIFVLTIGAQGKNQRATVEALQRMLAAHLASLANLTQSKQELERNYTEALVLTADTKLKNSDLQ